MVRKIALLILICLPTLALAQLESRFSFNGQNADLITGARRITVITPEVVQIPSTCSRQVVDGQRQVCENQSRYRQECVTIRATEICRNVSTEVCRPERRNREECHGTPDREVCVDRPAREICVNNPSTEVCSPQVRGRPRVCAQVGGGSECRTERGSRDCRQVRGDRQCRTITEMVNECRQVPDRRCDYVPARQDCRTVSYYEPVCRSEVVFRTEQYACTRTETVNRREEKTLKQEIEVKVTTNGLVEEFQLGLNLKEHGDDFKAFSLETKLVSQPKVFVILKNKDLYISNESRSEIVVKGTVNLEVVEESMIAFIFPEKVASASIDKNSEALTVIFDGSISSDGALELEVTHKTFIFPTKTIASLKAGFPSENVQLTQIGDKAALVINLKGKVEKELKSKNMKLSLKLISNDKFQGKILNKKQLQTEKDLEVSGVSLN